MTSTLSRVDPPIRESAFELRRQRSVAYYGLAGTRTWQVVDPNLARLAVLAQQEVCGDFFAIDILDRDRQWSIAGIKNAPVAVSARCFSLGGAVLARWRRSAEVFVTADASQDPDLAENIWVNGDAAAIRFFAAAPLLGRERLPLGMVRMWSEKPFQASAEQVALLLRIRDAAATFLEARRDERDRTRQWHVRNRCADAS